MLHTCTHDIYIYIYMVSKVNQSKTEAKCPKGGLHSLSVSLKMKEEPTSQGMEVTLPNLQKTGDSLQV